LETDGVIDLQTRDAGVVLVLLLCYGSGFLLACEEVLIEDAVLVFGMLALPLPGSLADRLFMALLLAGHVLILIECLLSFLLELPWSVLHRGQFLD
jgi:hypothetical protein